MKLLTFEADHKEQWGVLLAQADGGKRYALVPAKFQALMPAICSPTSSFFLTEQEFWPGNEWPDTLTGLLASGDEGMERLRKLFFFASHYLLEQDGFFLPRCTYPLEDVVIKAPIPEPRIYWGLVQNTTSFVRNHAGRCHANLYPHGHQRPVTCAVGAGEEFSLRGDDSLVGFNLEFGIIIGKQGRDIPADKALDYVAGYTNVLDCSRSQLFQGYNKEEQRDDWDFFTSATASWGGKKMDTSCPMGPWLVTKDEIFNPYNLLGYSIQNGRIRDRAHTSAQLLGIERTIAFYSSFATLYPGDVIHLGTVGVDGLPFETQGLADNELGTLEGEFEGLDRLVVPVVREKSVWSSEAPQAGSRPVSPVVRRLISSGQDRIDSPEQFDCRCSRNFWVSYGNYRQCEETEGLRPICDMPRFLNNPASALGADGVCVVAKRATDLVLSAEICLVVKKIAYRVPLEKASEYILGYSPMAAVSDQSIRQQVVEPATAQERELPTVYARWGDGYNQMLASPVPGPLRPDAAMTLTVNGVSYSLSTSDYLCSGEFLLSYISRYITLLPGDVITLGRLAQTVQIPKGETAHGSLTVEGLGEICFRFDRSPSLENG